MTIFKELTYYFPNKLTDLLLGDVIDCGVDFFIEDDLILIRFWRLEGNIENLTFRGKETLFIIGVIVPTRS